MTFWHVPVDSKKKKDILKLILNTQLEKKRKQKARVEEFIFLLASYYKQIKKIQFQNSCLNLYTLTFPIQLLWCHQS